MTALEPRDQSGTLDAPERLEAALEAATSPMEVRLIFDRAEALVDVAKRARMADEDLRRFVAVSLKAQRRGGQLLKETPRSKGRPWHGLPTIAEVMGLEPHRARHVAENWLAVAEVPDHLFEEYVARSGPMLSRAGLLRFRQHRPKRPPGRPRADGSPPQSARLRAVPDSPVVRVPPPPQADPNRALKAEAWQECVEWFARQQGAWRVPVVCIKAAEAMNPYADQAPEKEASRGE